MSNAGRTAHGAPFFKPPKWQSMLNTEIRQAANQIVDAFMLENNVGIERNGRLAEYKQLYVNGIKVRDVEIGRFIVRWAIENYHIDNIDPRKLNHTVKTLFLKKINQQSK